jgi:hypothetical protein
VRHSYSPKIYFPPQSLSLSQVKNPPLEEVGGGDFNALKISAKITEMI